MNKPIMLNCPTCSSTRTIYFDHVAKLITATCPKCDRTCR